MSSWDQNLVAGTCVAQILNYKTLLVFKLLGIFSPGGKTLRLAIGEFIIRHLLCTVVPSGAH